MSRMHTPIAAGTMGDIEALFDRLLQVDRNSDEFATLYHQIDEALESLIDQEEADRPAVASLLLEPKGAYRISRAG